MYQTRKCVSVYDYGEGFASMHFNSFKQNIPAPLGYHNLCQQILESHFSHNTFRAHQLFSWAPCTGSSRAVSACFYLYNTVL